MKKYLIAFAVLLIVNSFGFAQKFNDNIILTIDSLEVTNAEFERIFKKNNTDSVITENSVKEYLELFINFKLKVIEAERLGLDTLKSFESELNGYRRQLEKPYLTNKDIDDHLVKEAYERMRTDIKASHILIRVDENASPKDTAIAYDRIIKIRDRIINGEDFATVAKETSEDKSAQNNGGNLGFFTVFQMVYPFECAAYNTPIGEVSMPVRTKFGYHIIKVWDKRDAVGKVKVAHIMRAIPRGASEEVIQQAKDSINKIYEIVKSGNNFAELAQKYSDDKGSARNGGELRMFGAGKMIPEFEEASFALKNIGDISQPVKTDFGYHIIKLLDKKEIGSYSEMENILKTKVSRDSRSEKSKSAVVSELKKEYNFKYSQKKLAQFYNVVDETAFAGQWTADKAKNLKSDFVWFANKSYNQEHFANYMNERNMQERVNTVEAWVIKMFEAWTDNLLFNYEKTQLENKYPEFKYLMKEYHDGILLFELTDKMVWSKAVQDTAGLEEFYNNNKGNYMWGERFNGRIYTCNNTKTYKKVKKFLNKTENNNLSIVEILAKFNSKDSVLSIEEGIFSKGDNAYIDEYAWNEKNTNDNSLVIVKGNKVDPEPKKLDEAKGLITADYQTYLENKWIESLRNKYTISVNEELLKTIK